MSAEQLSKEMQARLDMMTAEIARLKARADRAGAQTRAQMNAQISGLEAIRSRAKKMRDAMRGAGEAALTDLNDGAEAAWRELVDVFDRVRKKLG